MAVFETESIQNIMPFGHGTNAIELADGRIFVTWYCGSYEGGEDQRIAGALRNVDGHWQSSFSIIKRFNFDGGDWIPEIGVPLQGPHGEVRLYFWACPISTFHMISSKANVRVSGGAGGGSFFPFPLLPFELPTWARDIPTSRTFFTVLDENFQPGPLQLLTDERGLIVMGGARRLSTGAWVIPYSTERKDVHWHSRFFVSDASLQHWESRGDIFAEPGALEPVLVQLPTGEIICYMRRGGFGGHVWRAVSNDECRTFSGPVATDIRNPHAGIDVGLSQTSGRLLLAFNDSYQARVPLSVGISDDKGATFRVRDVEARIGSYAYPKLLQTRDGLWHLFYSYEYLYVNHAWFDEKWLEEGRRMFG